MRYNAEHKTLDVYEGPWLNGLFAGNGELVYSSGDMYASRSPPSLPRPPPPRHSLYMFAVLN